MGNIEKLKSLILFGATVPNPVFMTGDNKLYVINNNDLVNIDDYLEVPSKFTDPGDACRAINKVINCQVEVRRI